MPKTPPASYLTPTQSTRADTHPTPTCRTPPCAAPPPPPQVPILEGSGLVQSAADAVAEAAKVGYPVLLKATGGGGGMGIFLCRGDEDVAKHFETSQHQGQAFFGNSGVFVEKYIEKAHHVEVQIFGDGNGNCIHLGERECSIQRRHQKVRPARLCWVVLCWFRRA